MCLVKVKNAVGSCLLICHMNKFKCFQASNLLVLGNGSTGPGAGSGSTIGTSALDISACTQQQPNAVLRVIIENMLYPVTLDVLHQIFSRYGKVLRIITFNKNSKYHVLSLFFFYSHFLMTVIFVSILEATWLVNGIKC